MGFWQLGVCAAGSGPSSDGKAGYWGCGAEPAVSRDELVGVRSLSGQSRQPNARLDDPGIKDNQRQPNGRPCHRPPRDDAVLCSDDHLRDAILKCVETMGSAGWKNDSGYQGRSLAENMMYRLNQLGYSLYSRTFERKVTELHVRTAFINTFSCLGIRRSVGVGQISPAV